MAPVSARQMTATRYYPLPAGFVKPKVGDGMREGLTAVWLKGFSGVAGICVDLGDDRRLTHHPMRPFPAASLIKLPIYISYRLACQTDGLDPQQQLVLRQRDIVGGCGRLQHAPPGSRFSLETIARWMLTHSDNTAANLLIERLGFHRINLLIQALDLRATRLERKLMDRAARAAGRDNWTSPADMLTLFQRLRHPPAALAAVAAKTLATLERQTLTHKLPHHLPTGTVVAHKTGELDDSEHDAGIIYRGGAAAIAVVLTTHLSEPSQGVALCRRVGVWTYDRMAFSP
ncbi:MAG: serine hydrolase [Desulfosarcinaceae bacterium]|nr:serine hydrolase [Desulfosarcinaceae bacterium]